jgi:long-chain acyl-CoA synthetase
VPIPTITEDDYEYIEPLRAILFCIWCRDTSKVNLIKDKVPNLKEVFSFNPIEGCKTGKNYSSGKDHQTDVDTSKSLVKPERFSYNHLHVERQVDQKELCSLIISFQTY